MFVHEEIGGAHDVVGLGHETLVTAMRVAKGLELGVRDEKASDVAQGLGGMILALDHEDLEDLPAEGRDGPDRRVHVFVEVVAVHDGVDLELDAVLPAQPAQSRHLRQMGSVPAPDLAVGFFVEGVA